MPARSKSQQRLFGMLHAYNKGEFRGGKALRRRLAEMSRHVSDDDARHFAETSHEGLPEKKAFVVPMLARLIALTKLAQAVPAVASAGDVWHTVKKDEMLSGIGKAYGVPWRDIQALNGLDNPDMLSVGQRLLIRRGDPSATGDLKYTVRKGDTLSGIGKAHGIPWRDIQALNNLQDPNKIGVGMELWLRRATPTTPATPATPVVNTAQVQQGRQLTESARKNFEAVARHLRKTFNNPDLEAAILANIGRESGYTFDHTTWQGHKRKAFDPNDMTQTGGYGLFQYTGPNLRNYKNWLMKNRYADSAESQIAFMKNVYGPSRTAKYGPSRMNWASVTAPGASYNREDLADYWHRIVETPFHTTRKGYNQAKIDQATRDHNSFMNQFADTKSGIVML